MKKVCCFLICALLVLFAASAMAEEECGFHCVMCTTGTKCIYCDTPIDELTDYEIMHDGGDRQSDATHCWEVCESCGEEIYKTEHSFNCNAPDKCNHCGAANTTGEVSHRFIDQYYDDTHCWYVCDVCGEESERAEHWASCTEETPLCAWCEQPCEPRHTSRTWEAITYPTCVSTGETKVTCNDCGKEWTEEAAIDPNAHYECDVIAEVYPNCKEDGSATLRCKDCGAEFEDTWVSDGECWYQFVNKGATHAYMCDGCGNVDWEEEHYVSCVNSTTCAYCGATGVTGDVAHAAYEDAKYDDNGHWWICNDCNEKVWPDIHWNFCDATGGCISCSYTGSNISTFHYVDEDTLKYTATEHWWICSECGKDVYRDAHEDLDGTGVCYCGQPMPSEEHECEWVTETVTAATCTTSGLEKTVCSICGEVSAEKTLYPTGHYWLVTNTVDATCEKEGRINYACRDCDATSLKKLAATGHNLVEGVCSACGYTEEVAAEEPAVEETPVEETAVAETVLENVTVEAAEGEALSSDVALIVSEPEEDVDVTTLVPEAIRETVAQVYFVRLTEKGETIDPTGSLKIAIELEEGADLTGKKLMLVQEDGTLLEITYEVVEGKMVFVTDAVGTFVLVDAPAE